jgi:acyl carrier protein
MSNEEILNVMQSTIESYVDLEGLEITPETKLQEDPKLNSYDFMSIIGDLEENLDVEVDERAVMQIVTLQDALDYFGGLVNEEA